MLLGDKGAGKRALVKAINDRYVIGKNKVIPLENMSSDYAVLDYSFLYVKDLTDRENANQIITSDDNLPKLNIWRVQESEQIDILEAALKPSTLKSMAAVIMLDLD